MAAGIILALFGLVMAYWLAKRLNNRGQQGRGRRGGELRWQQAARLCRRHQRALVAILLLALRPVAGIVDPLIALPLGGLVGALMMGKFGKVNQFAVSGLACMAPVAIMLLGDRYLAGITPTPVSRMLISGLTARSALPSAGPHLRCSLMSLATALTTAGTVVASNVFSSTPDRARHHPLAGPP